MGSGDHLPVVGDIIEELVKGEALDLLGLHVGAGIVEVEDDVALLDLLHKELLSSGGWDLVEAGSFSSSLVGRDIEPGRMLSSRGLDALGDILGVDWSRSKIRDFWPAFGGARS